MQLGDIIAVTVQDHYFGSPKLAKAIVYGKLHDITPDAVVLIAWEDCEKQSTNDGNEYVALLRESITNIEVLNAAKKDEKAAI